MWLLLAVGVLGGALVWNAYSSVPGVENSFEEADPELCRFDTTCEADNTLKASVYLSSFRFRGELTLRGLLVALVLQKFKSNRLMQFLSLLVLGAIPGLGHVVLARRSPAELMDKYVARCVGLFSIGMYCSIADLVHYLLQTNQPTACAEMSEAKLLPVGNSVTMQDFPKLDVTEQFELACPEPVLPALFPGLCIGAGGLQPAQSTQTSRTNALMAELLNRLAANLLVDLNTTTTTERFTFGDDIQTVEDFASKTRGVSLFYFKNSSAFGAMVCVKHSKTGEYRQIPLAFPGRTAVRDPITGKQLSVLSFHSALVMMGNAKEDCPFGQFRVQCFLGPEGWTGWKSGDEYHKPWAPNLVQPALPRELALKACRASTVVSCAVNLASHTQKLFKGGYALHGTCVDSTAINKAVVFNGRFEDFPLVTSGDASAAVAVECNKMMQNLAPTHWAYAIADEVHSILISKLPNDTSVRPRDVLDTLDRFEHSILGDFVFNSQLKRELSTVRQGWAKVLSKG
ncbi:hypothetical protein BASA81_009853 [Batrachochytrium salamandrivorans]|nr:hypothetical protein BASA81_009853 [Batrachochytrium salamandrivorans]